MKLLKIAGFNVLYAKKDSELASVRVVVNSGSVDELNKEDYGVAHYLEHMFFKGTEDKDYAQLNKEMSAIGNANAYTDFGRTVYYLSTLGEDYVDAFKLLTEMLFKPFLLEKEFNKEKNVILEECQARIDSPQGYFFDNACSAVWNDIGHSIIGSKETIENMTLQQIKDYRNKYYTKNNIYFVIVGNIDECQLMIDGLEILSDYEDKMEDGSVDRGYKEFKPNEDTYLTHDAEQSIFSMFYRAWPDFDLKSCKFVAEVFENGLGGGMHSMLFDRIREQLGLCYSINAFSLECRKEKSTVLYTMLDKKNIDKAKEEMLKVLEEVKKNGFHEEILNVSKKNTIFDIANSISSPDGYAKIFGDRYLLNGDVSFKTIKNDIENTTNDDIIKYVNWMAEPGFQCVYQNK